MTEPTPTVHDQAEKAARFAALHDGPIFVIPNPWDAGSASVLAGLGFKALATTSSGFAFTLGRPDGSVTLEELAAHVTVIDKATALPVSVDMENGFGAEPESAARAVSRIAAAGAVGGSIEDFDPSLGIYEFGLAVERVVAAAEAAHRLSFPFVFTARAENYLRGRPDLADTIRRLVAFEEAGADVLYAPGIRDLSAIRELCAAISKPVNLLAVPGLSLTDLAEAGVRRVSVGGALTWIAVEALTAAASAIRDRGDFSSLAVKGPPAGWLAGAPRQ